MRQTECTEFLQWALPHLRMRWPGFRRVRSQVCKRIVRRIGGLDVDDFAGYRHLLEINNEEWSILDGLCRVTISRFWRDQAVYRSLFDDVVPRLARSATDRGDDTIRCWSCGCASGEEPYSLRIGWDMARPGPSPAVSLEIVATDADPHMLERARRGVYPRVSIRDLPRPWQDQAFEASAHDVVLQPEYRASINWLCQDVRYRTPTGRFDLVLCRNLVFTYYDESLQLEIIERLAGAIRPGGALVVGSHEKLPPGQAHFELWPPHQAVQRRRS